MRLCVILSFLLLLVLGLPGSAVFYVFWTNLHPHCAYQGCEKERSPESDYYCEDHRFLEEYQGISPGTQQSSNKSTGVSGNTKASEGSNYGSSRLRCACAGCDRYRMDGGQYCSRHTCAKEGCFNKRYQENFCKVHRPASYDHKSKDPEDYDIEGYYDDNRWDYDDYDDAYDAFEDDPDEWDDYD